MPADASIYSLIKAPAPQPGPMDQYAQMMSLKALMGQNELQELQRQSVKTDLDEKMAVRDLFTKAAASGRAPTVAEMGAASPTYAQTYAKNQLDAQEKAVKIANEKAAFHRNALAGVTDQASYDAAVKGGINDGQQWAAQAPTQYDPAWVRQHVMSADQFIAQTTPKFEKVDLGGRITTIDTNPVTNPAVKTMNFTKTQTPGEVASNQIARERLSETKRHNLKTEGDPEIIESTAQAIANGQLAPLSGFALKTPMGMQVMSRVTQINPEFDPTQFQTRQKAEKDFATGKQGNTIRSFNVALSHLDTLSDAGKALKNGDAQALNKIGNTISAWTGGAAPTEFNAVKKIVGDEIVKAIVGSGGGVTDREEAAKAVDAANSPQQLEGVISRYKELMRGQLGGLRQQYETSTGKKDFDKFLSESGKQQAHVTPQAAPKPKKVDQLPDPAGHNGWTATGSDGVYVSNGKSWVRK